MANVLPSPKVDNPVSAAIEALKSGTDVHSAVYGDGSSSSSSAEELPAGDAQSEEVEGQDAQPEGDATPAEGAEGEGGEEQAEGQSDVEEVMVTTPDGKKVPVKIDFSNREQLKKYVHAAAGMRRFQAERDKVKQEAQALQGQLKELQSSWEAVKSAYQSQGVKGLVNLLANDQAGYDKYLANEFSRLKAREEASPAELERMELAEQLETERRERGRLQKEIEERLKQATEESERARVLKTEAIITPAFDKVRFAGKLGDPTVEHQLDSAVWQQALSRLGEYGDDVAMTPELVEKEFRAVASTFRKVINQQTEQKVKQVVQAKKAQAQTAAAAAASKGFKSNADTEKFRQDIKSGNLTDALKSFLGGKVKLG